MIFFPCRACSFEYSPKLCKLLNTAKKELQRLLACLVLDHLRGANKLEKRQKPERQRNGQKLFSLTPHAIFITPLPVFVMTSNHCPVWSEYWLYAHICLPVTLLHEDRALREELCHIFWDSENDLWWWWYNLKKRGSEWCRKRYMECVGWMEWPQELNLILQLMEGWRKEMCLCNVLIFETKRFMLLIFCVSICWCNELDFFLFLPVFSTAYRKAD